MGFFDSLMKTAGNTIKKETTKAVTDMDQSIGKGKNRSESFTFSSLPTNLSELQALPESTLDSPFKTAALTLAVLCRYKEDCDATFEMLDFLKGPENVSTYEKQFIKERLQEKYYKPFSFFNGATPENGYKPSTPYTIAIYENPYSFDNENWATLWVKSGGGDNMRSIKLRKKPSTGQWFLNDIQCLSDIRVPAKRRSLGVTDMKSQIYNNGVISVCVPSGWKLFSGIDSGGKETSEKVHIYKNIERNTDVFRKAGITICYYGEDKIYLQARDFYDNVKDIEPFKMGRYMWNGYTCTSMGYPYIMLEAYEGKAVFQVMLLLENNGERISLDDPDVCMIIESIKSEKRDENVT